MNLLLIMPNFFDYPKIISDELENMGYHVDFFDDRPSTNALVKAAIRMNPNIIKSYIKKYFNSVMLTVRSKTYDIVFLISGQSLSFSDSMVAEIKKAQPKAKFVLYQWDSVSNFPYIEKVQKYFDNCYSFDRHDCENNKKLKFLPLFYSRRYEELGKKKQEKFRYDFCFVGTAHPKKYKLINLMAEQLKEVYPNQFLYFYLPSPIVFLYRKIMNPELRFAHYKEFHYVPMIGKDMDELYDNSRCVLDSPQAGQLGLTMRVIEALGAKKKLITTNQDIVNYDFYREENVYVYKDGFDLNSSFFTKPYMEPEKEIYEKYSLRNWLRELMG